MQIDAISGVNTPQNYSPVCLERKGLDMSKNAGVDSDKKQCIAREEKKYTEEETIGNIESANKKFIIYDRRFEFSIHEKTKEIMVKVIDANTDEVIREIPPEKILDMVAAIWEAVGIFVDEKI
jgi:flagellar protein FlaG